MAATPPSLVEDIREAVLDNGFFVAYDAGLGERIKQLNDDNVHLASGSGLRFCQENILENPDIQQILRSLFAVSTLGLYRTFGAKTPGIFTLRSDREPTTSALLIQLWAEGSSAKYWGTSHKNWLEPVQAENGLLRVNPAVLDNLGLNATTVEFPQGGFVVLDYRTAFEIKQGTAITAALGRRDLVEQWRPMKLPGSLAPVAAAMGDDTITMNVEFI